MRKIKTNLSKQQSALFLFSTLDKNNKQFELLCKAIYFIFSVALRMYKLNTKKRII